MNQVITERDKHKIQNQAGDTYTLRPAKKSDAASMMSIASEGIRPHFEKMWTWDMATYEKEFMENFDLDQISVIQQSGCDVGYLKVKILPDHWYLDGFYLDKTCRAQGLGTCILRDLVAKARLQGMPIQLRVYRTNPASALYLRNGFKMIREDENRFYMETAG